MTQYFFDNAAGNDANSGLTTGSPKKSLAALNNLVLSGNVLSLKRGSLWPMDGTFGSGYTLDLISKNPAAPCTINDYGNANVPPIIECITFDNSPAGWTYTGGFIWTKAMPNQVSRIIFGGVNANLSDGGLAWRGSALVTVTNQWWWNAGTLYIYTGSATKSPPIAYGGLGYMDASVSGPIRLRDCTNIIMQRIRGHGGYYQGVAFQTANQDVTDIELDDVDLMYAGNANGFVYAGGAPWSVKRVAINRPLWDLRTDYTEDTKLVGGYAPWTRSDAFHVVGNYDLCTVNDWTIRGARHSGINVYDSPGETPGKITFTASPAYGLIDSSKVEYGRALGLVGQMASQNTIISGMRSVGQITRSQFGGTCKVSGCSWKQMRWDNTIDGFESSQAVWFQSWDTSPGNSFMVDVLFQNNLIENPISAAVVFRNYTATANSFNANTIRFINNTIIDVQYYGDARRTENASKLTVQAEDFGAGGAVPPQIFKNNNFITAAGGSPQVRWNSASYTVNAAPGFAGNVENVEGYVNRAAGDYHPTATGGLKYAGVIGYIGALDSNVLPFNNPPSIAPTEFVQTPVVLPSNLTVIAPGHNFVVGDTVFISGVVGMPQINGKTLLVNAVNGPNVGLNDLDGNVIDDTTWGSWLNSGTISRAFTLVTPYVGTDLALLKTSQSADTMTLTHPNYPPANLTRTQHYAWTLANLTFAPSIAAPVGQAAVPSTAGTTNLQYVVTAVAASGEESVGSMIATANSVNISTTAGAYVTVSWVAGGPGAVSYNIYRASLVAGGTPPVGAIFGFIGSALGTSFVDNNILPSFASTPPQASNPFSGNNNPGASAYFQQRRIYGGGNQFPLNLWGSRIGAYNNMDASVISQADDAFAVTLVSGQVNAVQWIVPMNSMLVLTSSGAWQVSGGSVDAVITPQTVIAVPQAYNGCSDRVPPLTINYDVLYVQSKGAIVRDLAYNFYVNIYTGSDMTVLANHLFYGHQILEWAWAEEPFKIIWAIREDGVMLSFTYMKEQDIYGWARHDTKGQFQSVCTISEGQENSVYLVVQRLINGKYVKYVEKMASRLFNSDVTQAWCVDAGLQYPPTFLQATLFPTALAGTANITSVPITSGGAGYSNAAAVVIKDPTGSGANVTPVVVAGVIIGFNILAGGVGYTNPTLVVLDAAGHGCVAWPIVTNILSFSTDLPVMGSAKVGDIVRVYGGTATVTSIPDTTHFNADVSIPLTTLAPAPPNKWSCTTPVQTVTGLDHLNGETVQVLADGNVQTPLLVTNGSIALVQPASAIIAGQGYQCQLQTLRLDDHGPVTDQGRRKRLPAVTLRVQDTRGLKVGSSSKTLKEIKERTFQKYGVAIPLITGDERIVLDPLWQVEGQILIQQDYPLPATVLAVIPEVTLGDTPSA